MPEVVVKTEDLTKRYGWQTAVDHLNLEVYEGEIFGFLGPNGAGKTTTLLMLLGLTEPTSGKARVLGYDPVRQPLEVKRRVGYLPENVGFYDDLTAEENLQFVAELNGLRGEQARKAIDEALEEVGLTKERNKLVGHYSRGMRQRLGIAELLVKDPKLVYLDEPTLGLDPEGITRMLDMIKRLSRERHITVILSSHLLHQVQRICDRVGIMLQGRLVGAGTIDELAKKKLGPEARASDLEQVYMQFFQEG